MGIPGSPKVLYVLLSTVTANIVQGPETYALVQPVDAPQGEFQTYLPPSLPKVSQKNNHHVFHFFANRDPRLMP